MASPATYLETDRKNRLDPPRFHSRYWILALLARTLRGIISSEPFRGGDTLLDFGCGNRPYEALFTNSFDRYLGADLPGNPHADVTINPNGTLPLKEGEVDCVLSSQVLEHVGDPKLYLREAHRVLKPQGTLLLSTHGFWVYHPDPTDFWRWTADGLKREITDAGFEIITIKSVMRLASVAVQLWQDATHRYFPSPLRTVYVALMQALIGFIERFGKDSFSPNASVYVVLARKP